MPKLRNGNIGDSNLGSLDCESGVLPTELPRSTSSVLINRRLVLSRMLIVLCVSIVTDVDCFVCNQNNYPVGTQ